MADGLLGIISELAKSDPDGVEMLVRIGLVESLHDQLDAADHFAVPVAKAMDAHTVRMRRAIVRSYVQKRLDGEDVTGLLQAGAATTLTSIAVHKGIWDRFKHPRDPQTGRFVEVVGGEGVTMPGHREDLSRRLVNWRETGFVNPGTKVVVHGSKMERTPQGTVTPVEAMTITHQVPHRTQHPLAGLPPDFMPQQLEVHPKDTNQMEGGARQVLDVGQFLTTPAQAHHVATASGALSRPGGFGQEVGDFIRPSSEGDRRAWRQASATGRAISALATPGTPQHAVGSLAQLIGSIGPQAETVLGPGIKRTAYRYRGTEKRPDVGLVRGVNQANEPTEEIKGRADALAGRGYDIESDQMDLKLRGDEAADYFMDKVPNEDQTMVSIAAGRVPPSQGAIIDADGDVTTEAMGFADDHYLPFDLKNLKALEGGQYVRTRASGGPTTEDIYTGLMTGTRMLQTVSNSGVFTVEFDPDLRGGKRMSDKARSMVGRYTRLLDAVQSRTIYTQDLDPATNRRLHEDALKDMGPEDPKAVEDRFHVLQEQERLKLSIEGPSEEELTEAATNRAVAEFRSQGQAPQADSPQLKRRVRDIRGELLAEEKENRVKVLQLDGEGYDQALKALQQEFPYFIRRVDWEPLQDFMDNRGIQRRRPLPKGPKSPDKGYVRPGELLPAASRQQMYNPGTPAIGGGRAPAAAAGGNEPPAEGAPANVPAKPNAPKPGVAAAGVPNGLVEIAAAQMSDLQRGLGRKLRDARDAVNFTVPVDEPDPPDDDQDAEIVSASSLFVRTMNRRHQDIGNWLATAPLDQATAYVSGLLSALDTVENQEKPRVDYADNLMAAHEAAAAVVAARDPFEHVDPLEHTTDDPDNARPAYFPEIDKLGIDPDKYESYLATHKDVAAAAKTLGNNPASKATEMSYRYQLATRAVEAGPNSQVPSKLGMTYPEAVSWVRNPRTERDIIDTHKAWAFKVASELADQLGGETSPKEAEPEQGALPGLSQQQRDPFALRDDPALRWGRAGQLEVAKALLGKWVAKESGRRRRSSPNRRISTR
jgi:hypothetical protein